LLSRAVWFQREADPCDGYVFLLDTVDPSGEMAVGAYTHDYLDELGTHDYSWGVPGGASKPSRNAVWQSLHASTQTIAQHVKDNPDDWARSEPIENSEQDPGLPKPCLAEAASG
jgi:hypothetical protein